MLAQMQDHAVVIDRVADTVDARHRRDDDHVLALEQRLGGHLGVDRAHLTAVEPLQQIVAGVLHVDEEPVDGPGRIRRLITDVEPTQAMVKVRGTKRTPEPREEVEGEGAAEEVEVDTNDEEPEETEA